MRLILALIMALMLAGCGSSSSSSGSSDPETEEPAAEQQEEQPEQQPTPRPKPEPKPKIQSVAIEGSGILWKPVSERDGNLVVLTPASFSIERVSVVSVRTGRTIERGKFQARTNGNRPTYRFSRPGRAYLSPCALQVGGTYYYIRDAASRNE